ncbi:UDP-glucuronic acid decarboxylase family protein [Mycobacterium sp. E136]|uniref:UDP-glucuronic acid decarboxylase family protein n=1 Tax=Mycobacterium sp. E136 TaxID=1834125 RepID=UPI0009FF40B8|nr:UDP-glucuronic acid decarboxylase family protein [Mycobacterium sp. E136]
MRRAFVAGGAGFIGSALCERLLHAGYEVLCLDNFSTGARSNVDDLSRLGRFSFLEGDVTSQLVISGPLDVVVHLASPASPPEYTRLSIETLKAGSNGTLQCLELAREKQARFILASTSEVYGDPHVHPQPESYWGNVNPIGPRSMYDEAKRFAEALTTSYRDRFAVNTGIARIFNTYGPRMRPNDGRAIPTFIWQALRGEPLTVHGDGGQTRSLCFVDDLVEGVVRLIESDFPGPVNLGNPEEITVLELAKRVITVVGSDSDIEFMPRPPDDPEVRCPDISLARQALGWDPVTNLGDGLIPTIGWFRYLFEGAHRKE